MFAPVFEKAAERHPAHVFAKLDTQNQTELRDQLGIEHIPTLMVFRDGILLYKDAGSPPAEVLDDIVAQAEALDMSEVRQRQQQESQTASDDGAA
jgi:thioredoxin 1